MEFKQAAYKRAITLNWQDSYISKMIYKSNQTVLVLVRARSSSVGLRLCTQNYKSLHSAIMICTSLINTRRQLLTNYTISSAN